MARTYKQKPRGSKAFDPTCRNHGSCGYCEDNRTFFDRKHRPDVPNVVESEGQYWDEIIESEIWPTDFWTCYEYLLNNYEHRFLKWLDENWEDFEHIDLIRFDHLIKKEVLKV